MRGLPPIAAASGSAPDDRRPGAFTREELDAAEPEQPPSLRRRWLVGFAVGAVGSAWAGLPFGILALPWARTPAGAGALLGTGLAFVAWVLPGIGALGAAQGDGEGVDVAIDAYTTIVIVAWLAVGLVALITGIAGTVAVARRPTVPR